MKLQTYVDEFLATKSHPLWLRDGQCRELVAATADWLLKEFGIDSQQVYIDLSRVKVEDGPAVNWFDHAVVIVDGLVHDPWYPKLLLPLTDYCNAIFGTAADIDIEYVDEYLEF